MNLDNDKLALASVKAAFELSQVVAGGTSEEIHVAFDAAAAQAARSIERPAKATTVAAVFVTDYAAILLKSRASDDRKRLLASLVFGSERTLRELHHAGSLEHIAEILRPYTDFSEEEVGEIVRRTRHGR